MAMSLQQHLSGAPLVVCELDGRMVDVATLFFGFKPAPSTSVVVRDGVQYITECADKELCRLTESLQIDNSPDNFTETASSSHAFAYIFIDVDGKDTALGLTAPPESFITQQSLQAMHDALRPGGILLLNVVARGGQDPIDALIRRLKSTI